jgi:3-dehydroquinate synthetase
MPTEVPGYSPDEIWRTMHTDKKKQAGRLRFVLPCAIGDVRVFNDIPEEAVKEVLVQ